MFIPSHLTNYLVNKRNILWMTTYIKYKWPEVIVWFHMNGGFAYLAYSCFLCCLNFVYEILKIMPLNRLYPANLNIIWVMYSRINLISYMSKQYEETYFKTHPNSYSCLYLAPSHSGCVSFLLLKMYQFTPLLISTMFQFCYLLLSISICSISIDCSPQVYNINKNFIKTNDLWNTFKQKASNFWYFISL